MSDPGLTAILGPWLMGGLVSATGFGFVVIQGRRYWHVYHKTDPLILKGCVALLMAFCCLTWAWTFHVEWWYLVLRKTHTPPAQIVLLLTPVFAALFAESFYASRVYRLWGRKWVVLIPAVLLALFPFATGVTAVAMDVIVHEAPRTAPDIMQKLNREVLTMEMWAWASAGSDVLLCAGLVTRLLMSKSSVDGPINPRTESVLMKILRLSLETAALTALVAGGNALALKISPETNAAIAFFLCQPFTYTISVVTTLLSRRDLRLPPPATTTETDRTTTRSHIPTILRDALRMTRMSQRTDAQQASTQSRSVGHISFPMAESAPSDFEYSPTRDPLGKSQIDLAQQVGHVPVAYFRQNSAGSEPLVLQETSSNSSKGRTSFGTAPSRQGRQSRTQ